MKTRIILIAIFASLTASITAQQNDVPVLINLKDGKSINAKHFGQLKCGTNTYQENYIIVRGMFLDNPTEMNNYKDIQKISLVGFTKDPVSTVGNQKGTLNITKKDGVMVSLEEAELVMSCYGVGDKYNQLIVQIVNPLTNETVEQSIDVKNIQSIIFK